MRLIFPLFFAMTVACDSRPVVYVEISAAPDFPALETFARLSLAVTTCDDDLVPGRVLELDATPTAEGRAPSPEIEIDMLPGTKSSMWLAAWEPCDAAACVTSAVHAPGCVCRPGMTPDRVAIAHEACSSYARVEAGGELRVSLTLTATRGLCPAPNDLCP